MSCDNPMRQPALLIANWKMNLRGSESLALARHIAAGAQNCSPCEIWLAPSFTSLPALAGELATSPVKLGAQNAHWSDKGAFTGEISVPMLTEHNTTFVIVGHSERRHIFLESDLMVVQRTKAVLAHGLSAVFCVGEKLDERERGQTLAVLERQLAALLDDMDGLALENVVLAYEPVWAIGTGKVAKIDDIESAHQRLAAIWEERTSGRRPRILYGGSVTPNNFAEIIALDCVDGALIGGASLDAKQFLEMAAIACAQGN